MVKKFLKEILIAILLLAAIVLTMAVLFYDSVPINKVVPEGVSEKYTLTEEMQKELDGALHDEQEVVVTKKLDNQEMDKYQNLYSAGKIDPFAPYSVPTPVEDTSTQTTDGSSITEPSNTTENTTPTPSNSGATGTGGGSTPRTSVLQK